MTWRVRALLLLGVVGGTARVDAQSVTVVDPGPGPLGRRLMAVLAGPHRILPPAAEPARLSREADYPTTVVVLGRSAIIEGRVEGDVIVVGGDAFLHPGAMIDGRVIAFGGAVYPSTLAFVRDGLDSYRDFTFDVLPVPGGYALDYRPLREHPSPVVSLPGIYGVRLPAYDRSDGLSLPVAPLISLDTGRYELEPTVTYRSDLGAVDPSVVARLMPRHHIVGEVFVGRSTFTNDSWIWSDLVNSAAALGVGIDTRNYYRADRAEGIARWLWQGVASDFEPYIGLRAERDRSVGPDSLAVSGPWSLFGRGKRLRMLRPNPPVVRGTLKSVLAGARWSWDAQSIRATIDLENEAAQVSPANARFVQSTLDGELRFPTFESQLFWVSAHVVYTFGDTAPPQRWSYLGGSGTISTIDLLSLGGDRLLFVESNYYIPIRRIDLRIVGSPSITVRHVIGSAGVGRLPNFEQNLALRFGLSFARLEIAVDPARRKTNVGVGLSFTR